LLATCAQHIVAFLEKHGFSNVFGLPGSHNMELFDALHSSRLKTYLATSELTAAFMAEAFGKATGKPAVLTVVPGPGLTYAMTGIAGARLESIPMLVIVSGCRNDLGEKKYQIHEMAQGDLSVHISKAFYRITQVDETEPVLSRALHNIFDGEPGPVIVEVPVNILRKRSISKPQSHKASPQTTLQRSTNIREQLDLASQWLNQAEYPCIYAGLGCASYADLLKQLSEKLASPVATTISGRGVLPEDDPLSVGYGFGPTGESVAREIFSACDVLITVGCKFSEASSGGWDLRIPEKHIRIDISADVLQSNFQGSLNICMDAGEAIKDLLPRIEPPQEKVFSARLKRNEKIREGIIKEKSADVNRDKIRPESFFAALRPILPRDSIMCCDCGAHQFHALSHFSILGPRTFLASVDFQAMGFCIPAMIAAQIAYPERKVIGVVGDGGFLMTGLEMVNIVREEMCPVLFVFRDNSLGLIEGMQKRVYQRTHAVKLTNPDYAMIAAAQGLEYCLLEDETLLESQLQEVLRKDAPYLVEVAIQYNKLPHYSQAKMNASARKLPLGEKIMAGGRILSRKLLSFTE
jgi:acetolactate synthase-1/2/3 large subunit